MKFEGGLEIKKLDSVEAIEAEIKMLQSKLEFYKELEKTKSPVEEAYKKVYRKYPVKEVSENLTPGDNWNIVSWSVFQKAYKQAQKDYKVGEYQEEPEENEWKNVALEFGKKLPVILPYNYDELPPDAWFRWVVFTYDKYMEQRDKESGYTPTPQTPEQVEEGLREAFRTAIKEGIIPEIKQPTDELIDKLVKNPPEFLKFELGKTLTDLIHRWWDDVFTTHSDWDMETSIEDLVDQIQMWLPKEQSAAGSQNIGVEELVAGWNDCLNKIKSKLR